MKIMVVVGARPNFMKAAPILSALRDYDSEKTWAQSSDFGGSFGDSVTSVLVHTGQHYDDSMSGSFFADLNIPNPDIHLGVGSGSHASQTAEIMRRFEEVLLRERPDALVVVGDVNSTLACALVATKVSFDSCGERPLIAHVEAGLRSFDHSMPEEINRILTDHVSDMLFVTETSGVENLKREGIAPEKTYFVGNTMIDSLMACREKADESQILKKLVLARTSNRQADKVSVERYALLTLHRPANVDNQVSFINILEGLKELASTHPVIFPAHPRTRKRVLEFGLSQWFDIENCNYQRADPEFSIVSGKIRMIEPLGYLDFLCLMKNAALVVTDSGGIQEETTCLEVPCVTVRENTERPVTVERGTNVLAGTDAASIRKAIRRQLSTEQRTELPEKWDGKAALRIVENLVRAIREKCSCKDTGVRRSEAVGNASLR